MKDIVTSIFEMIIIPLLSLVSIYIIRWVNENTNFIKEESDNVYIDKYLTMLDKTIASTVTAINQTYVEDLKKQNKFDLDAQKHAFEQVYNTVVSSLSEEAEFYLNEVITDLNAYITNKIEETVHEVKKK